MENARTDMNSAARNGDATAINNGFLWIIALVPLAWVLQMLFFVAIPLDCSLKDAFVLGEYVTKHALDDPLIWRLYWPSVVWAAGVDTLICCMDVVEVYKRGFDLGDWKRRWTAYLIPPLYVWVRGAPSLNGGTRIIMPYVIWWIGMVVITYFESGYAYAAVATALAFTPCVAGVFRRRRK